MRFPKPKRPSKSVIERLHSMTDKKGMIAVIEPDSGEYILAKTLTEGLEKAIQMFPGKVFYSIRIGYSYSHEHRGGIGRV